VRGIRNKIIPIVNSLQTIDFFTTKIIFFLPIEKWRKVFIKNPHIWPSPVSRDWRQFLKTKNNFKNHLLKPRFFPISEGVSCDKKEYKNIFDIFGAKMIFFSPIEKWSEDR
jgi:hypothetical protein